MKRQEAGPVAWTRREPWSRFWRSWARHRSRRPASTRSMMASVPKVMPSRSRSWGVTPTWAGPDTDGRIRVTAARQLGRCRSRPHTPRPGWPAGRSPRCPPPAPAAFSRSASYRASSACSIEGSAPRRRAPSASGIPAGRRPLAACLLAWPVARWQGAPSRPGLQQRKLVRLTRANRPGQGPRQVTAPLPDALDAGTTRRVSMHHHTQLRGRSPRLVP
jgi:hypothetical protein